jgi:hypothetical protein
MDELDVGYYPEDVMHVSRFRGSEADIREDTRVKDALTSLGLYHAGISVELEQVRRLEDGDTSTVECTFRATNIDKDNLCVIDPNKMGAGLFHHFTNGVVSRGNNRLYQSEYKKSAAPATRWDPKWFVDIPSGSFIERTVILKGYPRITPGKYRCNFAFSSPKVSREDRNLSGGRIWLGEVDSDWIDVELL